MFENTEIINHYEWMAYYYINNDSSGYTKDEIAEIDKFEDELKEEYGDSVRVITCSEFTGFGIPDWGGPKGDLCEYLIQYQPKDLPPEHWQSHRDEALHSCNW